MQKVYYTVPFMAKDSIGFKNEFSHIRFNEAEREALDNARQILKEAYILLKTEYNEDDLEGNNIAGAYIYLTNVIGKS